MQRYPVQSGLQKNSSLARNVRHTPGRFLLHRTTSFSLKAQHVHCHGPGLIKSSGNQLHVRMGVYEHISGTPAKLHTDFKKRLCNVS